MTTVRPLLAELARAHLVAEHRPGRYACHDLLRAYASEQTAAVDSDDERRAATRRMLVHYVHSANHGDRLLDPHRHEPTSLPELVPGVYPEEMADHVRALAWFATERNVLLTAIHQGVEFDAEVCELVRAMRRFLARQGHWHEALDALTVALAAAERLGDPVRLAFAQLHLGGTYIWFDRHDDAQARLDVARELYRDAGDPVGEAYTEHNYAWTLDRQERTVEALSHAERALELFRAAKHEAGQAKVLNAIGWFHALLGDYPAAIRFCENALELQTKLDDWLTAGQTWHSLGYAHDQLGDYAQAIACYEASIGLLRESGYLYTEAQVLMSLGDTHHSAGDPDAARTAWRRAGDILDKLGHPDADRARAKLASETER